MKGKSIQFIGGKIKYGINSSVRVKYVVIKDNLAQVSIIDDELVEAGDSPEIGAKVSLII